MELIEELDTCLEEIFYNYEVKGKEKVGKISKEILQKYLHHTDEKFIFQQNTMLISKLLGLKNQFIYTSNDTMFFFQLLTKYQYQMTNEIRDAIRELGNLSTPTKNKEVIKRYLNSPIIQDISFNGKDKYVIESESYGRFEFQLAKKYFEDNDTMIFYMEHNQMLRRCHTHTGYMASIFPELYAITSLCEGYFGEKFYHSYTYFQEENQVIDLCSNAVMDKESYYQLYQPQELSVILNRQLEDEFYLINYLKTTPTSPQKLSKLLKITLYKQHLNNIGYHGGLIEAPSIKVKRK